MSNNLPLLPAPLTLKGLPAPDLFMTGDSKSIGIKDFYRSNMFPYTDDDITRHVMFGEKSYKCQVNIRGNLTDKYFETYRTLEGWETSDIEFSSSSGAKIALKWHNYVKLVFADQYSSQHPSQNNTKSFILFVIMIVFASGALALAVSGFVTSSRPLTAGALISGFVASNLFTLFVEKAVEESGSF